MPTITITFTHPEAEPLKYTFGEVLAVTDNCQPKDWLTGKVVGLTLEEGYSPRWWYSIKLDSPLDYTEEYLGDDLVPETEIPSLQEEWEQREAAWIQKNRSLVEDQKPAPKFQAGMCVKFTQETGCSLPGASAEVASSRYVSGEDWSGWVYKLTSEHLTEPLEIGEQWIEPLPC